MNLDVDMEKETKITRYQLIQILLVSLAAGAGVTLINQGLGFVIIGLVLLFLLMPIILKIMEKDKTETTQKKPNELNKFWCYVLSFLVNNYQKELA
ncbi:unnamed protein product [marine sediment metagenome]|uniref:Uncharacterized protein n=1 Tax=marine sediment metagenome TaxID=412755 RepID=X1N2R3_9ZZZZ